MGCWNLIYADDARPGSHATPSLRAPWVKIPLASPAAVVSDNAWHCLRRLLGDSDAGDWRGGVLCGTGGNQKLGITKHSPAQCEALGRGKGPGASREFRFELRPDP